MSIYKRYLIFFIGMLVQSAGIALVVKSLLGTSPISSVPYVLSQAFPYTLGTMTFAVNMVFVVAQVAILQRDFHPTQLLQIPVTFVFAAFIDMHMCLLSVVAPEQYVLKLLVLLTGAAFIALGVSLQVIANVVMLSGEAIVNAIALHWHFGFGRVKTIFDTGLVIFAVVLSFACLGEIIGVREGTLLSAMLTGMMARFFIQHLSRVDAGGSLVLSIHLSTKEAGAVKTTAAKKTNDR